MSDEAGVQPGLNGQTIREAADSIRPRCEAIDACVEKERRRQGR
jgi:hypothetical protein